MSQQRVARRPRIVLVPSFSQLGDGVSAPGVMEDALPVQYPIDYPGKGFLGRRVPYGAPFQPKPILVNWNDKRGIKPMPPDHTMIDQGTSPVQVGGNMYRGRARSRVNFRGDRPLGGRDAAQPQSVLDIAKANEIRNGTATVAVDPVAAVSSGGIMDWVSQNTGTALLLGGGVGVVLYLIAKK